MGVKDMWKKLFLCIGVLIGLSHAITVVGFDTLEQMYDYWAYDYKKLLRKTQYKVPEWIIINQSFLPEGKKSVLDLGCADGSIGEYVYKLRPQYRFFGIDFSKQMVAACLDKFAYVGAIVGDLNYGLPPAVYDKKYDIIFATGCLEFVQNHSNLFDNVHRALCSGGLFWLTLQVDDSQANNSMVDTKLNVYSEQQARNILQKCNFDVVHFSTCRAAYIRIKAKKPVSYFLIIVQKRG
jgi:predicted TPR repeat methyltransferase